MRECQGARLALAHESSQPRKALSLSPVPSGTDATHAEHIETIKSRNYVGVQGDGSFVPGELGMGLVEGETEWNGNRQLVVV